MVIGLKNLWGIHDISTELLGLYGLSPDGARMSKSSEERIRRKALIK